MRRKDPWQPTYHAMPRTAAAQNEVTNGRDEAEPARRSAIDVMLCGMMGLSGKG